jgi:hypothetical protein
MDFCLLVLELIRTFEGGDFSSPLWFQSEADSVLKEDRQLEDKGVLRHIKSFDPGSICLQVFYLRLFLWDFRCVMRLRDGERQ